MNKDGRQSSGLYKPCPCLKEKHRSRLGDARAGNRPARPPVGLAFGAQRQRCIPGATVPGQTSLRPESVYKGHRDGKPLPCPGEQKITACRKPGDLL